jgi:hypothetical protein
VCLSVCVSPLPLLDNSYVNTLPRQRRNVGGGVFYKVYVVSNESRRLVLPITSCCRHVIQFIYCAQHLFLSNRTICSVLETPNWRFILRPVASNTEVRNILNGWKFNTEIKDFGYGKWKLNGGNLKLKKMRWRFRRSQWLRDLRHEPSSPDRTLGSSVRIPLDALMSVCVYCVFELFYV